MTESYCIVDKRVTPCTEPSGYQKDKRGTQQIRGCKLTPRVIYINTDLVFS